MPTIRDRDEENRTRSQRIKNFKRGPGYFKYIGGGVDVECIPTPKLIGKMVPDIDKDGVPRTDPSGRQIMKRAGGYVTDDEGRIVMGGEPKRIEHPIEVYELAGFKLPIGKPVFIDDKRIALKLRGMDFFVEVEAPEQIKIAPKQKSAK